MDTKLILLFVLLAMPAWGQQGDSSAKKYKWHHPWFNKEIVSDSPPTWPYTVIEEKNGVIQVKVTPPETLKPSAPPETPKPSAPPKKSEVSNIPKSPITTESKDWYKGGTLQGADIQTWLSSDYRNRLATAGDFFAYFSREMNPKLLDVPAHNFVRVMKVYATELEICITGTARDKNSEGFKAAELASLCYTLMFNNK